MYLALVNFNSSRGLISIIHIFFAFTQWRNKLPAKEKGEHYEKIFEVYSTTRCYFFHRT